LTLVTACVDSELRRLECNGSKILPMCFRREMAFIDRLTKGELGERATVELYRRYWDRLNLSAVFNEAVAEYPVLERLSKISLREARHRFEEEVNLVSPAVGKADTLKIKLLPERGSDLTELRKWLRHEFLRATDMLDETFGYQRFTLALPPMTAHLIRERYHLLWDIYVDSRLHRANKETIGNPESLRREFDLLFTQFPEISRRLAFEKLWQARMLTHANLFGLAMDPSVFFQCNLKCASGEPCFIPGATCPLCGFSASFWMPPEALQDVAVTRRIQRDCPDWEAKQGICQSCLKLYLHDLGQD
jgi:hypothetical protein